MNRFASRRLGLFLPALLLMAGCSGMAGYVSNPANGAFSVTASAPAVTTSGQVQLQAKTPVGTPAAVTWSVVRGENDSAIGQGSIDSRGIYTPPASLTRDSADIEIEAHLRNDPTTRATEIVTVNPGFLQPLSPENSSLTPGTTLQITAELAEVGGGTVNWSLAGSPAASRKLGSAYGILTQENCRHSPRNYTTCTVLYTAPPVLPKSASGVYVIASIDNPVGTESAALPLHILLNNTGVNSSPLANQAGQTAMVELGASGGNVNDADAAKDRSGNSYVNDCCGGTLGALVQDQSGSQYILSNNHVLAESDQGSIGDTIVQPGLIDSNCDQNAGRAVGSLRYIVPLATVQTNVDAALASANPGSVDPAGSILHLGPPSSGPNASLSAAAPAAGSGQPITPALFTPDSPPLRVAKSGRTTGLTCSTIDAIDLSVVVDYFKDCAETQPWQTKKFTGQIGIGGDGFSDSGDSGALIVNAANAQPLGLFFAGGTNGAGAGFSIANPIQDVLAALGTQAGQQFTVVGGAPHPVSCLNYDGAAVPGAVTPPEPQAKHADSVVRRSGPALVNPESGILGVATGRSADDPGEAAIIVYTDKSKGSVPVPQTIGGLRTLVIPTDPASESNGTAPKSLSIRAGIHLPENVLSAAAAVQQTYAQRLMTDPAIFGVGVTQSRDNPAEAALLVLVDMSRTPRALPPTVGGLRVRYLLLHRFHVSRSKYDGAPHPSNCALKSAPAAMNSSFDPERPAPIGLP